MGDMLNLGNCGVLKDESVFIKRILIFLTDFLPHIFYGSIVVVTADEYTYRIKSLLNLVVNTK